MTIGVMVDGKIVQRPYSVASPPVEAGTDGYEFYVRLVQGGTFTPLLWEMPVGQKMRMIGPKGKFMLEPGDERMHIFISSGTGNAPFVSMMKQAARRRDAPAGGVPERRLVRPRDRLSLAARGLGAVRRVPGHVHPDGLAPDRSVERLVDGPDGSRRDDPRARPRRAGTDARRTPSPTSAATRT